MHEKVVIVTGAAGGIGRATVEELVRRGARVVAVDLDAFGISSLLGSGEAVIAHEADVSDAVAVAGMVRVALDRFGRLDGIFNNAGMFGEWTPVAEYPDDVFERIFAVNVRGVQLGMKHAIPALRTAGGGAIVNTASTGALVGVASASAYVATKHAVLGLTRCAALELAAENISVTALCPGPTDTAMMADIIAASGREEQPLVAPSDVAEVAAWLLLDAPQSLSGTHITVASGG